METQITPSELRTHLITVFAEIWDLEVGGEAPELLEETVLLDTGLDSLGFAIYIGELDVRLDYDPFSLADDGYYPVTFGEFLAFYTKHLPS